ncbi:MAG: hypothetical protein D6776_00590 [Planctomycetota bacterium]|nr:MAG: hypothetical protein D6776_00590 [Planctomycetota bacterium]
MRQRRRRGGWVIALVLAGCSDPSGTAVTGVVSAPAASGSAQLLRRVEVLEQGLAARDEQLQALEQALAERDAVLETLGTRLDALHDSVAAVRTQTAEFAERLAAAEARRDGERQQLERQIARLGASLEALERRLEADERVIASLRAHSPVPNLAREVPALEARVIGVERAADGGLSLLLNAGRQQGVEPGWEFTIRRGERTIAKAQVESVGRGVSSARVVFRREGERVREGDRASTRP